MTFFFVEKGSQIFCYFSAYNTRKNRLNLVFREFSVSINAQKIKFSIKDFFSKCDQMRRKLRIWSHLLKKSLMENIFCAVLFLVSLRVFSNKCL